MFRFHAGNCAIKAYVQPGPKGNWVVVLCKLSPKYSYLLLIVLL